MKKKDHSLWYAILSLLLVVLCSFVARKLVNSIDFRNNDFFTFWLAGHMIPLGQNPYSSLQWVAAHQTFNVTWIPNNTFVYPLPLSLFFIPLGFLSLHTAYIVWVALSQLMIVASLALMLKAGDREAFKKLILPFVGAVILFRPTIVTLIYGQLSGLLLFILACIVFLWKNRKWELGALLLPFLALKPNLGGPILVLLSIYLFTQKQFRALFLMVLSGCILLLAGFILDPKWVIEYWGIGNVKLLQTFGFSPTIWGLSALVTCNFTWKCTVIVGGLLSLFLVAVYIVLMFTRHEYINPAMAIGLAIIVTLLITPYTWPYDQLLLLVPIIAISTKLYREQNKFWLPVLVFFGVDILALFLLYFTGKMNLEILNALVPLSVLILSAYLLKRSCTIPWQTQE